MKGAENTRSSHLVKMRMLFWNQGFTHYTAFFRMSPLICLWFVHSDRSSKYLAAFEANGVDSVTQKPVVQVYTSEVCVCNSVIFYYVVQMYSRCSYMRQLRCCVSLLRGDMSERHCIGWLTLWQHCLSYKVYINSSFLSFISKLKIIIIIDVLFI
jgi:hypothetical protein